MRASSAILLLFAVLCSACGRTSVSHTEVVFKGPQISIDVRALKEGIPEFYSVDSDHKKVLFFLIKVRGDVQSYFDACLSCYDHKLGFREENGYVVCQFCNVRYPVDELKTGIGGCYPIRLKGGLVGNAYVITRESLAKGERYF